MKPLEQKKRWRGDWNKQIRAIRPGRRASATCPFITCHIWSTLRGLLFCFFLFGLEKYFWGDIFRHILWTSIPPLLLMSVTGESNPIHRLLLWNEKLASFTARDQMHLSLSLLLSLSLSVLICKRLKGALSPGSSASFHAWFTLICLIGHKDLEMAHLSVENVLIFLRHCYVEVFDFSLPLSLSLSLPPPLSPSLSLSVSLPLFLSPSPLSFFPIEGWGGGGGVDLAPVQQSVWVHLDSS